jgi:dipeptidase E
MKLYLSSYRIPDTKALEVLLGKPLHEATLALIPNAKDYYMPRARAVKTREMAEYLADAGFEVTEVDLLQYPDQPEHLAEVLRTFDIIWVRGGNTFCLREAMRSSKFDAIISDIVRDGVVYAGDSAGACVAGTDIHGIELGDDPEFAETVIWEGLNLTPHYFMPHADNESFADFTVQMTLDRGSDPATVKLNDDQAWIEQDGKGKVITGVYQDAEVA